ncbi:MAG: hypothetical protein K6F50_01530 [Kiritimatiellae bacterium]|nr:hypothetical protein [Kiritimatiellia bacterium]
MKATTFIAAAFALPLCAAGGYSFDAGADLRIRQEIVRNAPQLPGGGMTGRPGANRGKTKNQMRFRPRVWAELKAGEKWRLYGRLCDEFRAGIVQSTHATTWPGEVVVDNLFVEGKNLFEDSFDWLDGVDIVAGRQDLYRLYGLDHVFVDGTAGDGSRSTYADMVRLAMRFDETTRLDLFALYNRDREYMRLGTHRSFENVQLTGFGGNETEMDDWGFGAVFSSKSFDIVDLQLFAIQKNTASFHRRGVKHPRRQVNLFGTKLVPWWTENFSTPLELMAQVGENGADESLRAWAAYAGFSWKRNDLPDGAWKPFASAGLLALSGDRDAATEDGGRHGWDPMWYRGVDDSEMMLYGTTYGVGWWSNMYNLKATAGVEFSRHHAARLMAGPMFAQEKDGLGGGDGMYKGFLAQGRYDFPILIADKDKGERFEIFGHFLVEWFSPGDYFDTDKPAWFARWQIDFSF